MSGLQMKIQEYSVVGRRIPTAKDPEPKVFRMQIFARNHVVAKSRFWYFMKRINKVKHANGEILETKEIVEKKCKKVKNYAIWLRYDSRTGTHNVYKEFRDLSKCGAISQMYAEMAGRHRARAHSISIMKIAEIRNDQCKRPHMLQLQTKGLKFPNVRPLPLCPKSRRVLFSARAPRTFEG
eukprot:GHVO01044415.1.p1 GENE.GHVO01044415.1~~GHVO01044415.1.p1  ORF type:complete len:188 (-),score=18.91 GHVO01044415.1:104-646(-)